MIPGIVASGGRIVAPPPAPAGLKLGFVGADESLYTQAFTQTVNIPGGIQAGDMMFVSSFVRSAVTAPAGFTLIGSQTGANGQTTYVWYKVADGTESGTLQVGQSVFDRMQVNLHIFRPSVPCAPTNVTTFTEAPAGGRSPTYTNPLNENAIVFMWGSLFLANNASTGSWLGSTCLGQTGTFTSAQIPRLFGGMVELGANESTTLIHRDTAGGENGSPTFKCVLFTVEAI